MEDINTDTVGVKEEPTVGLTDLQEYGISATIVTLLGNIRKYMILSQIQAELQGKSPQIQPFMREMYQFRETEMIMDIRTNFDMIYVYTRDPIIVGNLQQMRDKFEASVQFLTNNMVNVKSVLDNNYREILDEFYDKLKSLADDIASKSIYDEQFKVN